MADEYGHMPRGPARAFKALKWSLRGLQAAWLNESSFRLEVVLALVLIPAAVWRARTGVELVLLIGSILLVLSAELLNSAIESVIERYGAEHHVLAGRAKDMGSAAVFVLMVNVIITWLAIILPQFH